MNIKIKVAKISLALLLVNQIACQDDNNVKDYWKLEEPTVNIWEEGQTDESKTIQEKISLFNKNKSININQVAYGSNISFENINDGVLFDIESTCSKGALEFKGSYLNQRIHNIIYLYNFLPNEAIVDRTEMRDSLLECRFEFIASNKIGSKHSFSLNKLFYSTKKSNGLMLFSRDKKDLKNNFANENFENGYISSRYIDFSEDTSLTYFSRVSLTDNLAMKEPKIHCDVSSAEIKISEMRTTNTDLNINEYIRSQIPTYTGALLRKCRIFSEVVPIANIKNESRDYPKVWSPYFDILFKKPTLTAEIDMDYNPGTYPKFNNSVMDYVFAKIKITNTGVSPITVILPKDIERNSEIETMVFAASDKFESSVLGANARIKNTRENFKNIFSQEKIPDSIIKGVISSSVGFRYEKDFSTESYLGVGETKSISVILAKNFSCLFNNKYSESGFYIQGIKSKSESDKLKILIQDQNGSTAIPIDYYLSDLMISETAINPLATSDYLIDTVIIPYFSNLKVKDTEDYGRNYLKVLDARLPRELGKPSGYATYIKEVKKSKFRGFEKYCSVFE